MVLSDTQKTRYDVDVIDVTTLTKELDKFPTLQSPFIIDLNEHYDSSVNVFLKDEDGLKSNGFKGTDTVVFHLDCSELVMKNILSLNVSCTFEADIRFTVNKIGIVDEISTFTSVEKVINKQGHIDENIDISSVSNEELIYLIKAKKFKVFIEISSDLDIGSINLTENILTCEFDKILEDEILAVENRLMSFDTIRNLASSLKQWFYDKDEIDQMVQETDEELSLTSTNPVQNKTITGALNNKSNTNHTHTLSNITDLTVQSTTISVTSPTSGSNYFSGGIREITARKYGKIVNVMVNFYNVNSKQSSNSTDTTIGTMPTGWGPVFIQYVKSSYGNKDDIRDASFTLNTDGTIKLRTHTTTAQTGVTYRASFTYITP